MAKRSAHSVDFSQEPMMVTINTGDIFERLAQHAQLRQIADDLTEEFGVEVGRERLTLALSRMDLDGDVEQLVDEAFYDGPEFTGGEEVDEHGTIVARTGTYLDPDGTERYVIQRLNPAGELDFLMNRVIIGETWLSEDELGDVDWSVAEAELRELLLEVWPAVQADNEHYDKSPAETLEVARSVARGGVLVLASLAEAFVTFDTESWEDLDVAIAGAMQWAPLVRDCHMDPYRVSELVEAGVRDPDGRALEAVRARDESGDVDDDDAFSPKRSFTELPHETEADVIARAARELGLPESAIVWAHSANSFGEVAVVGDEVWVWTTYGPMVLNAETGDLVMDVSSDRADLAFGLHGVGDTLLVVQPDRVLAVRASDAALLWERSSSEVIRTSWTHVMVRDGGRVVAEPTSVACVELMTGEVSWTHHGRGDRPGLWPVGFSEGAAWLVRREGNRYQLVALDQNGIELGSWSDRNHGGSIVGEALVCGDKYVSASGLLDGTSDWVSGDVPIAKFGKKFLWSSPVHYVDGREYRLIGAGDRDGPSWMVEPPAAVIHDGNRPDSGWVRAGKRFWARSPRGSAAMLVGIGKDAEDAVGMPISGTLQSPPATFGGNRLVVSSTGRSGGHWLVSLDAKRLADI